MFEIALILLSFRWIGGILNLTLGIADLSVEYFDSSEYGVDEISESDGAIVIFGGLLEDLHGDVSVKLIESCVGSG